MTSLSKVYNENENIIEIGIDEAGRGPMFGRVYSAGVVLPYNDDNFKYEWLKDSKKFSSEKKINAVAEYIKEHAIYYHVAWRDEKIIDKVNIRQSVFQCMHECVREINKNKICDNNEKDTFLLVDGNDFKPFMGINEDYSSYVIPYKCIEGGDNKYCAIAAASILAKVERDKYIKELCEKHPELHEYYGIAKNKGYGTKQHIDGIKTHGITQWHRKTYGICKEYC